MKLREFRTPRAQASKRKPGTSRTFARTHARTQTHANARKHTHTHWFFICRAGCSSKGDVRGQVVTHGAAAHAAPRATLLRSAAGMQTKQVKHAFTTVCVCVSVCDCVCVCVCVCVCLCLSLCLCLCLSLCERARVFKKKRNKL